MNYKNALIGFHRIKWKCDLSRYYHILILFLLILIFNHTICMAQDKEALSFEEIIILPEYGYNSNEINQQIKERGINFEVRIAHIDSLEKWGLKWGFDRLIINTIKQFYTMGIINVKTNPGNVNIIIDGKLRGISDPDGVLQMEIPSGTYILKSQKNGYRDLDTNVTVRRNKIIGLELVLHGEFGYLTVKAVPQDVKIVILSENDKIVFISNIEKRISLGKIKIICSARGYEKIVKELNITPGYRDTLSITLQNIYPYFGLSLYYGMSMYSPKFDDDARWGKGYNWVFTAKAILSPLCFVDIDFNGFKFNKFEAQDDDNLGFLKGINISIVPGVYKDYRRFLRAYIGLGIEWNNTTIENGKFVKNEVIFSPNAKGKKRFVSFICKSGVEVYLADKIIPFIEYRQYLIGGQYSTGFLGIGMGIDLY